MMKISYRLTKENNKTEKIDKKLKKYIIYFKTIRYKPSALGNIIHSIFKYKLMRPVSNLRLPKEQKTKTSKFKKKNRARKVSKAYKSELFNKIFLVSNIFLKQQWDSSFLTI